MAWLTGLSEQGRRGGEVTGGLAEGEGGLVGSPPLLSPSLASVGRRLRLGPALALAFTSLSSGPSCQRKEKEGRFLASLFHPPCLPFSSVVEIPQSQPSLDASG